MNLRDTGWGLRSEVNQIAKRNYPINGDLVENINSPIIQVIGDSTGNENTEWVYLLAGKIATAYPNHNIKYALYDQPNSKYGAWVDIQHYGEDRHLVVANVTNGETNFIADADVLKTAPSGDLDIRLCVALDDWQQTGNPFLFTKYESVGHYCCGVRLMSNKIYLTWTTDGTTAIQRDTGIDTTSWIDGEKRWIRVTLDVDNGSSGNTVTGYTSTDGQTWNAGIPVVTAGVTSVFVDTTANYRLGSYYSGSGKAFGKYYEFYFCDGINGINLMPQPIEAFRSPVAAIFACSFGGTPTVYIFNASVSGSGITEWNNATYVKNAIPITQGALLLISLGHNDTNERSASYITKLDSFIALVNAKITAANVSLITQNPIISPQNYIIDRSIRRRILMNWAYGKGFKVIDTYNKFVLDSRGLSELLSVDGLHPNTNGEILWADTVYNDIKI